MRLALQTRVAILAALVAASGLAACSIHDGPAAPDLSSGMPGPAFTGDGPILLEYESPPELAYGDTMTPPTWFDTTAADAIASSLNESATSLSQI